jgi:hypothetical protein
MKKLLLLLFCLPMLGFGQSFNCNNPNQGSLIGLIIAYAHDNQKRNHQIKLQANGRVLYSDFPGDFSEKEELGRNKWWFKDNMTTSDIMLLINFPIIILNQVYGIK